MDAVDSAKSGSRRQDGLGAARPRPAIGRRTPGCRRTVAVPLATPLATLLAVPLATPSVVPRLAGGRARRPLSACGRRHGVGPLPAGGRGVGPLPAGGRRVQSIDDGAKDGATDGAKDGTTDGAKDGTTAYFLMDGPPARPAGHETAADAGIDAAAQAELAALLRTLADRTGSAWASGRLRRSRLPLCAGPAGRRTGSLGTRSGRSHRRERGASVTQAQHRLIAYARSREYAPREIRGAGVVLAISPGRRPHGD